MNAPMQAVIKAQRQVTPFGERYTEFLKAELLPEIADQVAFNIVAWQERKGELRTDRMFKRYEGHMGEHAFAVNEENIMANKSDGKVLEQMAQFREENSLDMCPEAEEWFVYITEGGQSQQVN